MKTLQAIDSVDSLVPNGNFVQGLAHWTFYPATASPGFLARHEKYYEDGDSNVPLGKPKYGLRTGSTAACWLNRNDLFEYPVRKYITNLVAFPVSTTALKIVAGGGAFFVESIDYASAYDALLNNGVMSFGLDRSVPMPRGTKLSFVPSTGSILTLDVAGEATSSGSLSRSFNVFISGTTTPPSGADIEGTLYFYVKKRPEKGSVVVVDATNVEHSGYYTVDRADDTDLKIVPQSGTLQLKAKSGDISGLLYNRDQGGSPDVVRLRIFGDLQALGVSVGDYLVTTSPARSYGKILSITADSIVQNLWLASVEVSQNPLPYTGTGQYVALTEWAVSASVNANVELSIPAVRYNLTLAFTAYDWDAWNVSLAFVKEQGAFTGETFLRSSLQIDNLPATLVRSFNITNATNWQRRIYKIQYDRAVPIPGLPVLKFVRTGTKGLQISHVAMFKGDMTELMPSADVNPQQDFDTLEYNTAPDGGVIPKGTVVPFIGGPTCPPGWKPVIGQPSDGDTPSNVVTAVPASIFHNATFDYNYGSDITTLRMTVPSGTTGFSLASNKGCGYFPWSNYKNYMAVTMRPPPSPPILKVQIRNPFTGKMQTLFSARLPSPPARPQRYAYLEVGLLRTILVPGQVLQLIPIKTGKPVFENSYSPIIGAVRVTGGFTAEEVNWQTQTYPSSYNSLVLGFDFWTVFPSPLGILTTIRSIQDLFKNINLIRMYDPDATGEPLPPVQAVATNSNDEKIEIDLQGDWRGVLQRCKDGGSNAVVRVLQAGYVKASSEEAGKGSAGALEHNHRVEPSPQVEIIRGVSAQINSSVTERDRPPVAVGHGHDYLGAGGYSRPQGHGVLMCIKL